VTVRARLFDADRSVRDVDLDPALPEKIADEQLLWVDVVEPDGDEIRGLGQMFGLERQSLVNLERRFGRPRLDHFRNYFEVTLTTVDNDGAGGPRELDVFVGRNHVVTVHADRVPFLEEFDDQLGEDTDLGRLDAPAFLASLLDWHVASYFRVVEELEREVDQLDLAALKTDDPEAVLARLAEARRRIGRVRRLLTPHREVYAGLARPDFEALAESDSAPTFRALEDRLDRAIDAVENARELLLGSFELLMTRAAQRTNEVMKVMTLASVVLLPSIVIAGVMGMNFRVAFFEVAEGFFVVLASMAALALLTLVVARIRGWI
jgi:magnesium/cobalt transport protein CorA